MGDARGILSVVLNNRDLVIHTDLQWFKYIKSNWSGVYLIIRPGNAGDLWRAIARWGNEDELQSDNPEDLLGLIHRHYGPEAEGYTQMLMGRMARKYS